VKLLEGRFRLGANFWSRTTGPRMWSRYDERALAGELDQARLMGLDLLRCFAFIPDFVRGAPGVYSINPTALDHLRRFARLAETRSLALLPSPLVGHMSGENFDLPGAGDRPLFSDPALLDGARKLVDAVASALREQPAVIGYALTNEAPLWGGLHAGKKPTAASIEAWATAMITAARAAHPDLPIGLGDGLMPSFPNEALARRVDFVGPHVYRGDADPQAQGYAFDHALALAARLDRPVILEEFGGSSAQVGDREHAALWNEALFAAFSLGARGAIGWCWSDFPVDTVGRELPYEHHAFELGFGLTRADGSEKPAADVVRAWRGFLDKLPDAPPVPVPTGAVLLRSSYVERDYPFSWMDRGACERIEATALALASQAGLSPPIRDEGRLEASDRLILVPSTQRLLTSTWLDLEARARAGATVYWSWFGGDHLFHQGAWCPIFERLTGCRHRLRYGCFDLPDDLLTLDGALRELPPLPTGAAAVRAGILEDASRAAYLPIEPIDGAVEVLSKDAQGRPILVEHRLGQGRVIFCAAPLERYASRLVNGSTRQLVRVYKLVAHRAGLPDPFGLHGAVPALTERLCIRRLKVGDRALVAVMNRSFDAAPLPAALSGSARLSCAPFDGKPPGPGSIGGKQVLVFDDAT